MFAAAALALLATLALTLLRAARGPSVFDRLLATNTVGTCTVLLLAVIGFLTAGRTSSTWRWCTACST
jgi:hypothetical protein